MHTVFMISSLRTQVRAFTALSYVYETIAYRYPANSGPKVPAFSLAGEGNDLMAQRGLGV